MVLCGVPPFGRTLGEPGTSADALVREKTAVKAPTLAVTVYEPGVALAVAVTLATPWALVTAVAPESVAPAPEAGAEKFTVTPLNGLPPASFTVACSAVMNVVEIAVACGVPPVAVTLAGGPAVLVSEKAAVNEPTLAMTGYDPAVELAVAVTLTTPWALVTAVLPESVAPAPEAGAAKFTVTPLSGLPPAPWSGGPSFVASVLNPN